MQSNSNPSAHTALSIIIPTLNEEDNITQVLHTTVEQCSCPQACEIIIVDGGSTDATIARAQRCTTAIEQRGATLRILRSVRGRASQMNLGAQHAQGDILLFLHADTRLPHNFDLSIHTAMKSHSLADSLALGAFRLNTDKPTRTMQWICWWANLRARLFALPYGDQALFIRRPDFMRLHMFPALEIMEDFAFVRMLKRHGGTTTLLNDTVVTSARRWHKRGYLFTTLCNQIMILGYYLHIPTRHLARWYRR